MLERIKNHYTVEKVSDVEEKCLRFYRTNIDYVRNNWLWALLTKDNSIEIYDMQGVMINTIK